MELMGMEGQIRWIRDLLARKLPMTDDELKSFCAKLLNETKSEDALDDCCNEWSTISAEKLNSVAMLVFTGKKGKAELLLEELDELVIGVGLKDATEKQREVILYCRDVLRWQNEGGVDGNEEKRLVKKWEDFGGKEVEAMMFYLKGSLGLKLKIRDRSIMNYYLEAHHLDSKCLAWYHHSYRIIRQIRVKEEFYQVPSRMEKYLAKTAYNRCGGKNTVAAADYGLMLKDMNDKHNEQFWKDLHSAFVSVFEETLKYAVGDYRIKIRIYLAEFLYFGEGPLDDKVRGREMFSELERDYPQSFEVLYKVGNLYRLERNFERAGECYKRALDLEPTDMPCILDYLRVLKPNNDQAEIVRVLEKALSPEYVTSENDNAKLQRELELAMRRSAESYFRDQWKFEYADFYVEVIND